jgi:NAD(P)-dependent dehydrogenase (short-subunit alcohol dehydrogenase family)
MSDGVDDRTVLITGSGSGIGDASARAFAAEGWMVYATDVDGDRLVSLADSDCVTQEMDVTDEDSITAVVEDIRGSHGRLDCVVNNAGVAEIGALEDIPIEEIRREFDVNVHGSLRVAQATLPLLREGPGGRIVNVSSVFGRVAVPGTGAYSASKFALEGMSDALRRETVESPVEVVLVEPAWVQTPFLRRLRENLAARERSPAYDRLYRVYDRTDLLGGWSFAVSPETAAGTVYNAATADQPDPRYLVGPQSRAFEVARMLPTKTLDALVGSLFRFADFVSRK